MQQTQQQHQRQPACLELRMRQQQQLTCSRMLQEIQQRPAARETPSPTGRSGRALLKHQLLPGTNRQLAVALLLQHCTRRIALRWWQQQTSTKAWSTTASSISTAAAAVQERCCRTAVQARRVPRCSSMYTMR
jgi:hypothetical protein